MLASVSVLDAMDRLDFDFASQVLRYNHLSDPSWADLNALKLGHEFCELRHLAPSPAR